MKKAPCIKIVVVIIKIRWGSGYEVGGGGRGGVNLRHPGQTTLQMYPSCGLAHVKPEKKQATFRGATVGPFPRNDF